MQERASLTVLDPTLKTAADYALARAVRAGAGEGRKLEVEFYFVRSRSLRVEVRNLEVETVREATSVGLGVRVLRAGCSGFAHTSSLARIDQTLEEALENSRYPVPDPYRVLPEARGETRLTLPLADPTLESIPLQAKIERARAVEAAARAVDPRVRNVRQAMYAETASQVLLATTRGVYSHYPATTFTTSILAVAEDETGQAETGWSFHFTRRYAELEDASVGRDAARRALSLLGAAPVASQRVPVVFDPFVFAEFLEVFSPAFTAEAVQKGKSLFAGKIGAPVASPLINLDDDGTFPHGLATAPVDDEGTPMQKTSLLTGGFLQNYLYDTYTAAKAGAVSTGNAVRASYKAVPVVRPTNLIVQPGTTAPETLLAEVKAGFYVLNVMGLHTANPISGDFSVGASGLWIENGALVRPVRGITLAGNFLDFLAGIDGVGNDLRLLGGIACPTVRVAVMSLSGERE